MSQTISVDFVESDIAVLTFDTPGKAANVLSAATLAELDQMLDQLEARSDLAGLVIRSAKPGIFFAGADLREFAASLDIPQEQTVAMCRRGQTLFGRLSRCPFPTVAAIDGVCLGGGAEMSVWCDRRLASDSPKTEIGFPEVKLGLFPGWGGTARLPRIVGLGNAVQMITSGESVDAEAARAMGLVTDVVPADRLLDAAVRLVRDERRTRAYEADRSRWSGPIEFSESELGFLGATAAAYIQQQTKGHYPAPMAALEVLLAGAGMDIDSACQLEASEMAKLFGSPINAALLNVFFLTDRNKKDRGIEAADVPPHEVQRVGVVGAGIMGAGIAAAALKREVTVRITDANPGALERGVAQVLEEVSYNRRTKSIDPQLGARLAPRLQVAAGDADVASCDLVIEAVVENAEVKQQVFAQLEPHLAPHTVLATNTSTIPITRLAAKLKHPERFCGIHFFNPVRRMKLVEVIRGEKTSDQTVATAVAYAKRIGKSPIVVHDGPGFLVNRLLFPYMNEALELVGEGAPIPDIEKAATRFGMPMGPIALYDMVGLDTAFYAGRIMWEAFPDRIVASPILPALVKAGRLGQKSGKGFYSYENRKNRPEADPQLEQILRPYIKPRQGEFTREELTNRLFLPMLLEATRVLEARIVRNVRDVDLGLIFGLGFPPFKGGLLYWADSLGAPKILEMLKPLEHLGTRMQPTAMLQQMAADGRKFYDEPA